MFDEKRLIIKEEVSLGDVSDFVDGDTPFLTFIDKLNDIIKCSPSPETVYVRRYYDDIEIFKIVEREETDKEYGKRVAKAKGEYEKYLKLKAKFEKE